jgi:hypothetical protein
VRAWIEEQLTRGYALSASEISELRHKRDELDQRRVPAWIEEQLARGYALSASDISELRAHKRRRKRDGELGPRRHV